MAPFLEGLSFFIKLLLPYVCYILVLAATYAFFTGFAAPDSFFLYFFSLPIISFILLVSSVLSISLLHIFYFLFLSTPSPFITIEGRFYFSMRDPLFGLSCLSMKSKSSSSSSSSHSSSSNSWGLGDSPPWVILDLLGLLFCLSFSCLTLSSEM